MSFLAHYFLRGKFVYNGPTDKVVGYFEKIGHPNHEGQNIADHVIDCIYDDEADPEEVS